MTDSLLEAGIAACRTLGYDVVRRTDGPPAVATPSDGSRGLPAADGTGTGVAASADGQPAAVALEPLAADAVTPTMLVSRLWNDSRHGRRALFVVPEQALEDALAVLRPPALVRDRSRRGLRSFYAGPDRVFLAEGGYAAVRTGASTPEFDWSEEDATGPLDDPAASVRAPVEGAAAPDRRAAGDVPARLVCRVDDEPVAVLDGVDDLCRPAASSFPCAYRRGADRRFHVRTADGRDVGTFDGVAAMRRAGVHPVPMPLVPEHVLPAGTRVAGAWVVLSVPDDDTAGADVRAGADEPDPTESDRRSAPPADATLYAAGGRVALHEE
jgi:hypothetical protein